VATAVSKGGELTNLEGIALDANGEILVANLGVGSVIRVDPVTGAQTIVSSRGMLASPAGIAIVPLSTMIVDPAENPSAVPVLGGSATEGGLDITLDATVGGLLNADFDRLTQQELNERILEGDLAPLDFAIPGDTFQLWDIEFAGTLAGLATLVFGYDDSDLGPFPEEDLAVYHFTGGAWVSLGGIVDALNNTITVQTPSFSAFALGVVPEPSTALLLATGVAGLALYSRRRLKA
jgi:hypothetical protein